MTKPRQSVLIAASLMLACLVPIGRASAEEARIDTLKQVFAKIGRCWKRPVLPAGAPGMQITVMVSFLHNGEIFGHPRITFESEDASDNDRIIYRTAVMNALEHCVPMPFTEGMADAIAGRPITLRFDDRRKLPKPTEKRAWLTTTIL
jgi:hypothetical protein